MMDFLDLTWKSSSSCVMPCVRMSFFWLRMMYSGREGASPAMIVRETLGAELERSTLEMGEGSLELSSLSEPPPSPPAPAAPAYPGPTPAPPGPGKRKVPAPPRAACMAA